LRLEISKKLDLHHLGDFHDGWALGTTPEAKKCFVNKQGDQMIDPETKNPYVFELADRFSEGFAAVYCYWDGKIRFLKTDGTFLPGEFYYEVDWPRFSNGYAAVQKTSIEWGYLYTTGNYQKADDQVTKLWNYTKEGFARRSVTVGNNVQATRFHFYDKDNNQLDIEIEQGLVQASDFSEGYAPVMYAAPSYAWSFVDTEGKLYRKGTEIVKLRNAADINPQRFGWFKFRTFDDNFGFVNLKGETLKDEFGNRLFRVVTDFSDGLAIVTRDNKTYAMDTTGKYLRGEDGKILEFNYGEGFEDGVALISLNSGEFWYLTKKGKLIKFGNNQQ